MRRERRPWLSGGSRTDTSVFGFGNPAMVTSDTQIRGSGAKDI